MTDQGGPEVLTASLIRADIHKHTEMPGKIFFSKTLNGFSKISIIASYLAHYMKYKVIIYFLGFLDNHLEKIHFNYFLLV